MDYKKIYDDLCDSRKHRPLEKEVGYEIHHIVPRCDGGSDENSNLVKLTYREHFMAHLLLSNSSPNNISYKLASVYFLKRPEVIGSRTYQNIKDSIEGFKRYQRYLSWSEKHEGRIKISSFYDKSSVGLRFHKKYSNKAKALISTLDSGLSDNNLNIHLEVLKVLILVKDMGYKGVYGWHGANNRGYHAPIPKYAFNKIKQSFIELNIIDGHGDFIKENNPLNLFKSSKQDLELVLKSDIETKLSIKGALYRWNSKNRDKTIVTYRSGNNLVLEPVTPFLGPDFKYSLEIFKPISYRKAKEIIEYLLENT